MASMRTKSSSCTTTQSLGGGWSSGSSRESGGPVRDLVALREGVLSVLLTLRELFEWQELWKVFSRGESLDGRHSEEAGAREGD